jgi:hypothetical protein
MFGLGPRLNTVFQSRWKAGLWSMSVLLVAYCTVPFADSARNHGAAKAAPVKPHKSPWTY